MKSKNLSQEAKNEKCQCAGKRYRHLSEEKEGNRKRQYCRKLYKNLPEHKIRKLVECRKKYYKIQKIEAG